MNFTSRFAATLVLPFAVLSLSASGCARKPALSPEGAQVDVSRQSPAAGCQSRGEVVGESGGSGIGGGRWVANDKLIAYAMSDVRNRASAAGANYVQIDPPQLGSSHGTTSTVTITGAAYRCGQGMAVAQQ
ncbi:MAG TPA: DUF4156 domain-containing protein [Polyangiaceae bacterium]|jgi:hypothetical protein